MSKSNITENDLMEFIFKGTAPSWNAATNLYLSLHTADPGEAGNQATSEANYTSYARVVVPRSGLGWTVTANQALNAALLQFPQCTGGSSVATYVGVGTAASGNGQLLYSGALSSSLSISPGIQPQISAGALVVAED
jgi:hypothetical protein